MHTLEFDPLPSVVQAYKILTGVDPHTAGRKQGADLVVKCVSAINHRHGDARPSLRINVAKDVWYCDACTVEGGKSTHLVVAAGRAKDLSEASLFLCPPKEVKPPPPPPPREMQTLVAEYEYCAAEGNVLYRVQRFGWTNDDGSKGKTFAQQRLLANGKWDSRMGDVERVPYRFPQIIYAASQGKTVFLVEGEKDADRLVALGLEATTNAGGANWKWDAAFAECFRGIPRVVVIGDNDPPGREAARARGEILSRICGSVHVVESMPGVSEKGDVSDWLDAHPEATQKELRAALAPVAKLIEVEVDDGSGAMLDAVVVMQKIRAQQHVVVPSVPFGIPLFDQHTGGMKAGRVTVLAARTSQGKTALAQSIAMQAAYRFPVMVFSLEMGQAQWADRMWAQRSGMSLVDFVAQKRPMFAGEPEWQTSFRMHLGSLAKNTTVDRMDELIAVHQPALVIVDHLRHVKGWLGNGKQRADLAASEIMYAFPEVAKKRKTHFLLLHQLNRQAGSEPALEDLRDAGAVEEVADNVMLINRPFKSALDRPADGSRDDDVMHAHMAKTREAGEMFAHLVWHGPLMLARAWEPEEEARTKRCCTHG